MSFEDRLRLHPRLAIKLSDVLKSNNAVSLTSKSVADKRTHEIHKVLKYVLFSTDGVAQSDH